ncbi:MAG: SCP2 sterol-binding domain-containing protein [Myxococcaceae bacterium]|nr:SCP2 sterol-binding domain-containing protein [Myxococcaceae bacterium]
MPTFPSKEWAEEAIRLLNTDPEAELAGAGWEGDFGAIVLAEPGKLAKAFVAHLVPQGGRIVKFKVLADPDDLEEIDPAYVARAPFSVWKGLIQGTLDPVEAVLKRKIDLKGDIQPLMERLKYKGIADRVMARLETRFADEL